MLTSYLKIAWKVLLRRKFFTFISLFGISFTLVVLMLATAILDNVFAPQLPEPHARRTLYLSRVSLTGPKSSRSSSAGYGLLDRYIRTLPDVERVSITTNPDRLPLYHRGEKLVTFIRHTDGAFWRITRFEFLEGGPFTEEDDRAARQVAVINATMRDRLFDGEPALGRTFVLDGRTFRVVGVVHDVPIVRLMVFSEIWLPIGVQKGEEYKSELVGDFTGIILANDRSDLADVKAEVRARMGRVEIPDARRFDTVHAGADTLFETWARGLLGSPRDETQPLLLAALMAGAGLLFMLLPALNLININLSRILERASEIGVRKAFGASSATLVGQFVVENVVLTLAGGLLGLLFSWLALAAVSGSDLIPYVELQMNYRIFGYGLLLAILFGVLSGVYPAWKMSRLHPAEALGGRS